MTNVLIDEANRKHAEHAARAAAVAGARSFEEARTLGAAHVQKEAAGQANAAAYMEGVASASNARLTAHMPTPQEIEARIASRRAAKVARRAAANAPAPTAKAPTAPTVKALKASTPTPKAVKSATALVVGSGDIALRARVYVNEQANLGRHVSASAAVAHIIQSN